MDSDFGASVKGEAGSANPTEVRTLAIIPESWEADRRVLGNFWNGRQPQHTGLSGNLRPDALVAMTTACMLLPFAVAQMAMSAVS